MSGQHGGGLIAQTLDRANGNLSTAEASSEDTLLMVENKQREVVSLNRPVVEV